MFYRNKIIHITGLIITLLVLWLMLSGHYTLLLIALGVLSVLLVVVVSLRMELIEYEEPEVSLQVLAGIPYVLWLLKEIIKSNIDVCKRILNPKLPISPKLITVKSSQHGEFARVAYANSITLTPGTISIDVDGDDIEVHALSEIGVEGLRTGEMDKRVSEAEIKKNV